ncbi:MAG: septum formation protein Maf [Calditrichaeota bacterium]|nr:septum formation protein Maf [Calditrichota bacterium]
MAILNTENKRIVLASRSPRRIQLLKKIVTHFESRASDENEDVPEGQLPEDAVKELARRKAEKISRQIDAGIILGADSVVVVDKKILGKPADAQESRTMLQMLSGKSHQVMTGVCAIKRPENRVLSDVSVTEVKFRELSDWEIDAYIRSNKPFDKAGSYGIQDDAAVFVEEIRGCYYNVVGLPVSMVYLMVRELMVNLE